MLESVYSNYSCFLTGRVANEHAEQIIQISKVVQVCYLKGQKQRKWYQPVYCSASQRTGKEFAVKYSEDYDWKDLSMAQAPCVYVHVRTLYIGAEIWIENLKRDLLEV